MPADIMVEKAKQAAQSLSRLLKRHAGAQGQAGDVESYAILAGIIADRIKEDWDRLQVQLSEGIDGEAARTLGAAVSIAADTWSEVATSLQALAAQVVRQTGESVAGVGELADEVVRIEEIRGAARRVVDAVNAANGLPLDQDMLARSQNDSAAGRLHKGKEVIARLRSRKSP
jgi:hypothetical protein